MAMTLQITSENKVNIAWIQHSQFSGSWSCCWYRLIDRSDPMLRMHGNHINMIVIKFFVKAMNHFIH